MLGCLADAPSLNGTVSRFLEPADNRIEAMPRDLFCEAQAFAVEIAGHRNLLPVELAGVLRRLFSARDEAKHVASEIFVVVARQRAGETEIAKGRNFLTKYGGRGGEAGHFIHIRLAR